MVFASSQREGCHSIGQESSTRDGDRFDVTVTASVPAPPPWAQDCSDRDLELDAVVHLGDAFSSGETVEIKVNEQHRYSFTAP